MRKRPKIRTQASTKKKRVFVVVLAIVLVLAVVLWLRARGTHHFTGEELKRDVVLALPVGSSDEAMEFAKRRLDLFHRKPFLDSDPASRELKWEWTAWVVFMDGRARRRAVAKGLERCSTDECERVVRGSEPEFDYWKVTFKTVGFIPSYYCELKFSESGVVVGASAGEACGFRK